MAQGVVWAYWLKKDSGNKIIAIKYLKYLIKLKANSTWTSSLPHVYSNFVGFYPHKLTKNVSYLLLSLYSANNLDCINCFFIVTIQSGSEIKNRECAVDEEQVKILLSFSLNNVPIEPAGSFMTIHQFRDIDWRLNCTVESSNFTCGVQIASLIVSFHTLRQVSSTIFFILPIVNSYPFSYLRKWVTTL